MLEGVGKMSSATHSEEKRPAYAIIFLVIIGVLAAFFLSRGLDAYLSGQIANSMTYFILGLFGIFFVLLMASRFAERFSGIPPRVTLTLLQCTSCAFKSIRNFQMGDFVPKPMGTCPSCGGPFIVESIYSEEKSPAKKKKDAA